MRLYNASLPNRGLVQYPAGVPGQLPVTRWDLLTQSANQCRVIATALGLPPLLANVTVAQRIAQIADYLGIIH